MPGSPTDHLANERTYLAWVRTAITIMAFGFVVARFGLFLKEIAGPSGASVVPGPVSEVSGVLLVLAGSVLLVLAFARFHATRIDLEAGRYRIHSGLEWGLTALMVAIGVGLAIYLVLSG